MPKRINRLPGIKQLSTGKWQARVYHERGEESRNFSRQDDAKLWQRNLKSDLDRCPSGITRSKREWVVTLLTPTGVVSKEFADLDPAISWKGEAEKQLKLGTWIDPEEATLTLSEYVPKWKKNKVEVSGKTLATYNSQLRVHILPTLGGYSVTHIRNADIRGWIGDLADDGVGATTIKQSLRLLNQILDSAVTDGYIVSNPSVGIKLPKQAKAKAKAFTADQVDALARECGKYGNLVHFLALTGLRISEALALQVRDIDLVSKKLSVVRSWTSDETGKKHLGATKTRETRVIPVSPEVEKILEPLFLAKGLEDFIFTGSGGTALDYGHFRRTYFAPAVERLGLGDGTIHWLRHTCASMMIRIGAPITTITYILGHSSIKMTLDTYAHYYEDDSAEWMDRLSGHLMH